MGPTWTKLVLLRLKAKSVQRYGYGDRRQHARKCGRPLVLLDQHTNRRRRRRRRRDDGNAVTSSCPIHLAKTDRQTAVAANEVCALLAVIA